MSIQKNTIAKRILVMLLIISVSFSSVAIVPKRVQALAVPNTCALFDFTCIMRHSKDFVLDRLAVTIANQLIQKMTTSVINWINTGFKGSPSFLTNPEGYFLDAADQVTGEFLGATLNDSALSQVCSPFSFDLRLNLALNQSTYATKRYTCTLGKIINNTQNAVRTAGQNSGVTISGDPNGATLGDFMSGDFKQGGFGGFIAYSMEPQNNPIGAELMARSDLQSRIGSKQAAIHADLNRGQGFLSWQKCTDVTSQFESGKAIGLSQNQEEDLRLSSNLTINTGQNNLGRSSSIKQTYDAKTDTTKVQDCQNQTPGSVLASTMFNTAAMPQQKLVLVKTISDSIDAMLGALVNQMLTQGLAALSSRNSGVGGSSKSYLVQLSEQADNPNSFEANSTRNRGSNNESSMTNIAENNMIVYDKIIGLLTTSKNNYTTAKLCFTGKLTTLSNLDTYQKSYAQSQINTIDLIISRDIDPLISSTTVKKLTAGGQGKIFQDSITSATTNNTNVPDFTTNDIDRRQAKLESAINAKARATQSGIDSESNVDQEYATMQAKTATLDKSAQAFQNACARFPNGGSGFGQ